VGPGYCGPLRESNDLMAIVGFALPHATARILSEIEVPGTKEPVENFHITMLMLDDEAPIGAIADAMEAAYQVASRVRPFTVRVDRITSFPGNPDGVPVICPIESPELHEVWESLKTAFDERNIGYSKKYPVFKPHVTLSYSEEPFEDRVIHPVEWGAHELVVWGGDRGDRRVVVSLPFSLLDRVAHRYRVAVQSRRSGVLPKSVRRQSIPNRLVERFKAGY
jgi:2'-5' RNA ligase